MAAQPVIYVIDDDDAVRDSLHMLLECHGFPVRTYASGAAFLRDEPPDESGCLLIDVDMPDMKGLDLLDQLRKRGVTIPAIVMTGGLTTTIPPSADRTEARLVEKPFGAGELIGCIETALGRCRA
jgi:two-component system, LuxR family, response regulator FixJ